MFPRESLRDWLMHWKMIVIFTQDEGYWHMPRLIHGYLTVILRLSHSYLVVILMLLVVTTAVAVTDVPPSLPPPHCCRRHPSASTTVFKQVHYAAAAIALLPSSLLIFQLSPLLPLPSHHRCLQHCYRCRPHARPNTPPSSRRCYHCC